MIFDGFLLIDKPAGMSSFGVVARVRRVLSQAAGKKVKVGHTGTLDPFATGLMIIVVGSYCKKAAEFSKMDKSYVAELHLGDRSSTGDLEGEITEVSDREPDYDEVNKVADSFVGDIEQTPPVFSAIKINGVRAYKLARKGIEVDMPVRKVKINSLKIESYCYPDLEISCNVSSGTYIRTLAEDIGLSLGVGAYCSALRRTIVGEYNIRDAITLDDNLEIDELLLHKKVSTS